MSTVTIELETQIDNLRGFQADLDVHYEAAEGDESRGYALRIAILQLGQRITVLEDVARHHRAEEVSLTVAAGEARVLTRALEILDGELVVDPDAPPALLWSRIREVLAAADALVLAAARSPRAHGFDHDRGPRAGVVLPLARTGR